MIFKAIYRNIIHAPWTSLINLIGLSLSLTIAILLSLYCFSELTTDNFHENKDQVYLYKKSGGVYTPGILSVTIANRVPGLLSIVRVAPSWEAPVFQVSGNEPVVSDILFADKEFFSLFSYKSVEGDLQRSLDDPLTLVLSSGLAKKLFGNETAIGKQVKYNNDRILTVSAVFREQENNSFLRFSAITSIATKKIFEPQEGEFKEWGWNNFQTFFLLQKGYDPLKTVNDIIGLVPEKEKEIYAKASLIPLEKIYFSQVRIFGSNYIASGNIRKVISLLIVATLVLLIALVNFINIFSSQWRERIKQTGIMKVLGAGRSVIMVYVLSESLFFFLSAFLIAIQLASAFSPVFHNFTGITFSDRIIRTPGFLMISILTVSMLSILFSIIPAIRISGSNAIDNLHKTLIVKKKYSGSRVLVIFQFAVSIALISFTILIQKQVTYGTSTLGINQDNIIGIKMTPQLSSKSGVLRSALENEPDIDNISFSQYYPGKPISNWGIGTKINGETKMIYFDTFCADGQFFDIMGLQLVAGEVYSDSQVSDNPELIVNETFLKEYNISDPLQLEITTFAGKKAKVRGAVRDFHYKPINEKIAPLVIRNEKSYSNCIIHIKTENFPALEKTVENIKKIVSDISPSFPVEVTFLDNAIQNLYKSELSFRRTFLLLALSAIGICCMGILAISISECQRRIKEIGIRRVNGAKSSEIFLMLNQQFMKLVGIAFVLSTPVSFYFIKQWLKGYAYKTEVSWWIFVVAVISALIIALITVVWQSLRAATRNPVESLRYE